MVNLPERTGQETSNRNGACANEAPESWLPDISTLLGRSTDLCLGTSYALIFLRECVVKANGTQTDIVGESMDPKTAQESEISARAGSSA
jgi:hypothetical protein